MYLSDTEIRERLNIPERRWRPAVEHFERMGFPRKDPLVGLRYWPAVEAWLMRRYLDGADNATIVAPDETENWDAFRRHARP